VHNDHILLEVSSRNMAALTTHGYAHWYPEYVLDTVQNLVSYSVVYSLSVRRISSKSAHNFLTYSTNKQTNRRGQHIKPGIERVQALADISRSALCCHSNETRASIANPPNSAQLDGTPIIPPSYIRVVQ